MYAATGQPAPTNAFFSQMTPMSDTPLNKKLKVAGFILAFSIINIILGLVVMGLGVRINSITIALIVNRYIVCNSKLIILDSCRGPLRKYGQWLFLF